MANWKRPQAGEVFPYQEKYIALTSEGDIPEMLSEQLPQTIALLSNVTEEQGLFRYAPEKWSIKEVIQHMIDTERIMTYRALRFARKDQTALPGFEENDYAPASMADRRMMIELLEEFTAVRLSSILLFRSFTDEMINCSGPGNGRMITVNALGFIVAGHELHHRNIFIERYGLS
jgi:hypothetical protein